MSSNAAVRLRWMQGMYLYTLLMSGLMGLGMLVAPSVVKSLSGWPANEPMSFGILGAIWAAFGVLSVLGLRHPLKYSPLFLTQLLYKCFWFAFVFAPMVRNGTFPPYGVPFAIIFAIFIVGDLIATPYSYLFGKQGPPPANRSADPPHPHAFGHWGLGA